MSPPDTNSSRIRPEVALRHSQYSDALMAELAESVVHIPHHQQGEKPCSRLHRLERSSVSLELLPLSPRVKRSYFCRRVWVPPSHLHPRPWPQVCPMMSTSVRKSSPSCGQQSSGRV